MMQIQDFSLRLYQIMCKFTHMPNVVVGIFFLVNINVPSECHSHSQFTRLQTDPIYIHNNEITLLVVIYLKISTAC